MFYCKNCEQKFKKNEFKEHLKLNTECLDIFKIIYNLKKTHKNPNFIELCAGTGGLSTGLIKSGWHPILLNDNNKNCCDTLQLNHPNVNVLCCSMTDIDYSQYSNKIDLLCAGIPCQSFSQIGKREGLEDTRGQLMFRFIDIINEIQPTIFLIENVKGLITHDKGNTLNIILKEINNSNLYNVKYECLNAFDFEVPQKRERVFIIGILKTLNVKYTFPIARKNKIVLKDILYNIPPSKGITYSNKKIKLFKSIKQGGCWINLPIEQQKEYLGKSFYSGGGKRGILRRLSMDKPSLTLLCSPTQKQTERCHPLYERPLTIREYARIQTFNDDYQFKGSITSQYKQIGNSVPVNLAKIIGFSLLKIFTK
jgi:DNA (cytosine-5)-methyltransferase 1